VNNDRSDVAEKVQELMERYGLLVSPELLDRLEEVEEAADDLASMDLPVITEEVLRGELDPEFVVDGSPYELVREGEETGTEPEVETREEEEPEVRVEPPTERPPAAEYDSEVEVLENVEKPSSRGDVEEFVSLFVDRLNRLRKKLKGRMDDWCDNIADVISRTSKEPGVVSFAALVTDVRETERSMVLNVEDETGMLKVIVSKRRGEGIYKKLRKIAFPGIVLGIRGFCKGSDRVVFVNDRSGEVRLPGEGLPEKRPPAVEDDVAALFLGDVHVGSNKFEEDLFHRLIERLYDPDDPLGRVKYVLITGDVVDGVGIYPGQREELDIPDIDAQYEKFAKLLEMMPDWVEIVVIPGNHDAIRQALPQPPLSESDPAAPLRELDVHLTSNPSTVRLHGKEGVEVLLYHGQSFDDIIVDRPDLEHDPRGVREAAGMCIEACHLAPKYGGSVPIAPDERDRLVIERKPHVLAVGHTHIASTGEKGGCTIISTGTFQRRTEFQKKVGIEPTVGTVYVLNMRKDKYMSKRLGRVDLLDGG